MYLLSGQLASVLGFLGYVHGYQLALLTKEGGVDVKIDIAPSKLITSYQ